MGGGTWGRAGRGAWGRDTTVVPGILTHNQLILLLWNQIGKLVKPGKQDCKLTSIRILYMYIHGLAFILHVHCIYMYMYMF